MESTRLIELLAGKEILKPLSLRVYRLTFHCHKPVLKGHVLNSD